MTAQELDIKIEQPPITRLLIWFSAGATSAVAAKLAVTEKRDGEIPHGHSENCDVYKLERDLRIVTSDRDGVMEINKKHRDTIAELTKDLEQLRGDKERLDWLDNFYKHPEQFTIQDCITLYGDKENYGIRKAIDSAIERQKEL